MITKKEEVYWAFSIPSHAIDDIEEDGELQWEAFKMMNLSGVDLANGPDVTCYQDRQGKCRYEVNE